jgi:hypothetical protein
MTSITTIPGLLFGMSPCQLFTWAGLEPELLISTSHTAEIIGHEPPHPTQVSSVLMAFILFISVQEGCWNSNQHVCILVSAMVSIF